MSSRIKPYFATVLLLFILSSCLASPWDLITGNGEESEEERALEPTAKFSLAIGGVAPGRDELILYDEAGQVRDLSGHVLNCLTSKDILHFENRPGFDSYAAGSGVRIVPTSPGISTITCLIDGTPLDETFEVTIPPQNLIQILMAEAGTQIANEADVQDEIVQIESSSPTGNAVAAVIRNRVNLIEANGEPELFGASLVTFGSDPSDSQYDAVIAAPGQFAPTDPANESNQIFSDSQDRNFLNKGSRVAYDQAVLTAAGIYNGDIGDPTDDSFGFRSPSEEEWAIISSARGSDTTDIPDGCGVSDETFPALAPLQIVLISDLWTYEDGRPAFIFIRHRGANEGAVANRP